MNALARSMVVVPALALVVSAHGAPGDPHAGALGSPKFVVEIDNPYFPLVPGATLTYEGQTEGTPTSDVFHVTHKRELIAGVSCVVVTDLAYEEDVLVERTKDFFAQDDDGNVWYFGEDTEELDEFGQVISTAGTWRAGVDGASAGIVMEAHPKVGDQYAQEDAPDVAEDRAKVLSLSESLCVPYGCFSDLLLTKEWTPLEHGVVEHKYYAKGIGFLASDMVKGGDETTALVSVKHGVGD